MFQLKKSEGPVLYSVLLIHGLIHLTHLNIPILLLANPHYFPFLWHCYHFKFAQNPFCFFFALNLCSYQRPIAFLEQIFSRKLKSNSQWRQVESLSTRSRQVRWWAQISVHKRESQQDNLLATWKKLLPKTPTSTLVETTMKVSFNRLQHITYA